MHNQYVACDYVICMLCHVYASIVCVMFIIYYICKSTIMWYVWYSMRTIVYVLYCCVMLGVSVVYQYIVFYVLYYIIVCCAILCIYIYIYTYAYIYIERERDVYRCI